MASRCCWASAWALCRPPAPHAKGRLPAGRLQGHDRRPSSSLFALSGRAMTEALDGAHCDSASSPTANAVQSPGCGVRAVLPGARLLPALAGARKSVPQSKEGCHDHGHVELPRLPGRQS